MASCGALGAHSQRDIRSLRRRYPDDRLLVNPRPSTCGQRSKKDERSGCMGRSRGGLTTKIHALVDADGRPIRLKLTAGHAYDGRSAADMFETLGSRQILLADRAYDRDGLRQSLKERGAWGCIRPMPTRVNIPAFSPWLYKQRNAVERFFNKLKHFRAIATRYDKRDDNFLASIQLAAIRIWLRSYE